MTGNDPDIFAGLTFAEDLAAQEFRGPRAVEEEPPNPDRDGRKWRRADPRLPEDLARRIGEHLAAARAQLRSAARRGDAVLAANAQRRIDLATEGSGAGAQWWSVTVAEANAAALAALEELDATWGVPRS